MLSWPHHHPTSLLAPWSIVTFVILLPVLTLEGKSYYTILCCAKRTLWLRIKFILQTNLQMSSWPISTLCLHMGKCFPPRGHMYLALNSKCLCHACFPSPHLSCPLALEYKPRLPLLFLKSQHTSLPGNVASGTSIPQWDFPNIPIITYYWSFNIFYLFSVFA